MNMMDFLMAGTLLAGFGLIWLPVEWCQRQLNEQD